MYFLVTAINTTDLSTKSYWIQAEVRSQAEEFFANSGINSGPASVHKYGVQHIPFDALEITSGIWAA